MSLDQSDAPNPETEPDPGLGSDPQWPLRCRSRLRAALEFLADHDEPVLVAEVRAFAEEQVPLNDYDASKTKSGATRAWNNFDWNINTMFGHAGWLHGVPKVGLRLTTEGRAALDAYPDPMALFEAGDVQYFEWDDARKEHLADPVCDPGSEVLHAGSGAVHALRAVAPVLTAWKSMDSAFLPGTSVWNAGTTALLADHLAWAAQPTPATLPDMDDAGARVLAAEILALLVAPFSDVSAGVKRAKVRSPLMLGEEPPALPWRLSADLERGFVHGGKALVADPVALLRGFTAVLTQWWQHGAEQQALAWGDPWLFRDLVSGLDGVDERLAALVCLAVHPQSFTTVLRSTERARVVKVFGGQIPVLTGDCERDLKAVTLALQQEQALGQKRLMPPKRQQPLQSNVVLSKMSWCAVWESLGDGACCGLFMVNECVVVGQGVAGESH